MAHGSRRWRQLLGCGAIVAVSFGVGSPALAQTSNGTYTGVPTPQLPGQQTGQVQAVEQSRPQAATELAFTGTDALELAAVGLLLIGSGTALRWSARSRHSS